MLSPYQGPLAWATGDGTAVAATTTQTSLLTSTAATGKWAMPGGFFIYVGQMLRLKAAGRVSTPASTQGNLSFQVVIGAVNVAASPTFTSLASQTNITWELEWLLTLRAVGDGTLANFLHTGNFLSALVSATNLNNLIPATAPAVGTGFNSSAGATFDLQATWSNNTAGNTITLHQYLLESLN
jgi:hypothetical protein